MTTIIRSDNALQGLSTLGNITGINAVNDWAAYLDFENMQFVTKLSGVTNREYKLDDIVEVSRPNLQGDPVTYDKSGRTSKVGSLTQVRTGLTSKGLFGVLTEDIKQNFFVNSVSPITQTITIPASSLNVIVSCIGSGNLVVTGGTSSVTVTEDSPAIIKRPSSSSFSLTVTVNGNLTHAQVEWFQGLPSATSPITTPQDTYAFRNRETVKIKHDFLSKISANKANVTVLAKIAALNPVSEQTSFMGSSLTMQYGNKRVHKLDGVNVDGNLYTATQVFDGSLQAMQLTQIGKPTASEPQPIISALRLSNGVAQDAINGNLGIANNVGLFDLSDLLLGTGFDGGIPGLSGVICKVAIFDRALTDDELKNISKSWS